MANANQGFGGVLPAKLTDALGEAVDLMRAVKRALDPKNILNPGKVFQL